MVQQAIGVDIGSYFPQVQLNILWFPMEKIMQAQKKNRGQSNKYAQKCFPLTNNAGKLKVGTATPAGR